MKKILFLIGGLLLSSIAINAQTISYFDGAILFSDEENNGTARFNAMSGAFGALGGDLSAADINPAGLAVFNHTEAAITLGLRNTDISTSFYGTSTANSDSYLNMTQAGAVLVFNNPISLNWTKFALGINYSVAKNFENDYIVNGNSGLSNFIIGPSNTSNLSLDPFLNYDNDNTNDIFYDNVDGQFFGNSTDGQNERTTISFAAQYNEKLHIGLGIVTHRLEYYQKGLFEHSGNDNNGNLLDASFQQELKTYGQGAGLNIGIIAKPTQELRLGLSFQTPIWYNLTEEFTEDLEIKVSNNSSIYHEPENSKVNVFEYDIVTPAKATASVAYIFGKEGLISLDYTLKNYTKTKLKPTSEFVESNKSFSKDLQNTSEIRLGTEWRVGKIVSLRGGYFYKQSPFTAAINTDYVTGFSLGTGFKFGNTKLDLAYQRSSNTGVYGFVKELDAAELDMNTGKITATLVIGL